MGKGDGCRLTVGIRSAGLLMPPLFDEETTMMVMMMVMVMVMIPVIAFVFDIRSAKDRA